MESNSLGWAWKEVIHDILEVRGYSQSRIARDVSVSKEAISKLVRGATREPRFHTGSRLLALHQRLRPELAQQRNIDGLNSVFTSK